MQAKGPVSRAVLHMILVGGSLVFLFPLLWMVTTSLKPVEETMLTPPRWIPSAWRFDNYLSAVTYGQETLGYVPFLEYGKNTVLLCLLVVIGTVVSNALIAYGFARIQWRGRDTLFGITLATMMVPFRIIPWLTVNTCALTRANAESSAVNFPRMRSKGPTVVASSVWRGVPRSYSTSPSTNTFARGSAARSKRCPSRSTRSASFPTSMLPMRSSSIMALAPFTVRVSRP